MPWRNTKMFRSELDCSMPLGASRGMGGTAHAFLRGNTQGSGIQRGYIRRRGGIQGGGSQLTDF